MAQLPASGGGALPPPPRPHRAERGASSGGELQLRDEAAVRGAGHPHHAVPGLQEEGGWVGGSTYSPLVLGAGDLPTGGCSR